MIITKTPVRISLLGGGTDYPSWFELHGGLCIGGTINKYSYITVRRLPPYHPYSTRVVYSTIETVTNNVDIKHRAIRAALDYTGLLAADAPGLEITHTSDLPSKSGTGSSSAFLVGLLNALYAFKGEFMTADKLACGAVYVEQELMKETVGVQDQCFAAYGGLRCFRFLGQGKHGFGHSVSNLMAPGAATRELESWLMLYFTGSDRSGKTASDVAKAYAPFLRERQQEQWSMIRLAEEGIKAIRASNWSKLGELLDQAWAIKRSLAPGVSNPTVDDVYGRARIGGAIGGKLMGAGGGGMMLLVVPPENQERVSNILSDLVRVPFRFESQGTHIIHAQED